VRRKKDNDWVKKCMQYKVEGARPRGSVHVRARACVCVTDQNCISDISLDVFYFLLSFTANKCSSYKQNVYNI